MSVINQKHTGEYSIYNGDCCEVIKDIPDASVGFSIFSPPFSNLFVYSNSERDMGNCSSDEEFMHHFSFLIGELKRIIKPGRLCAVHCIDLPLHKFKDGVSGLKDFPGMIIKAFQDSGFIYHSRVTIWKSPVVEMTRTKAHGLLHKTLCSDSSKVRQGCPDYLVVFRNGEIDSDPVHKPKGLVPGDYVGEMADEVETPIDVWQRYASPVWFDINQTRTLNYRAAKNENDEKHICPLQLDVIERAIQLWTKEGDIVFTPFMGVGSEVYCAVRQKRKGIGIELKPEYFEQAVKNLNVADEENKQLTLF